MRRRALLAAGAALTALIAVPAGAQAGLGGITSHEASPGDHAGTHDVRSDTHLAPTDAQIEAARQLVTGAGQGTRVTWDDRFGTPRTILRYGDPLSGPQAGSPAEVARSWLDAHRGAFGLTAGDVTALELTQSHELTGTGTRVVNFVQTFASGSSRVQAVRGGSISVAVRQDGRILSYAGTAVRHAGLTGSYDLSAGQALEKVAGTLAPGTDFAAEAVGQKAGYTSFARGPFGAGSYVQKAGFPTAQGVRAAYQVLFVKAPDQAWDTVIDAGSGEILYRADLVAHESEGTVFENFPGAPRGGNPVIKPFGPTEESPAGYTDPTGLTGVGGPTTFGNNANSYANYSNFLVPADEAPRPVSATSQFNFSYSQNWARTQGQEVPPSYVEDLNPAATNLFFQHNRIHDEFYRFGFTESAGNFQVNNNGNGGEQGDPVLGLVHAGATTGGEPTFTGRDNAYMLTLPDGIPPWSGMFLWEPINDAFEGPFSDGNFDASVIEHEYAHGLSNRYVGQEDNALSTHQSGSMGEGWGDWYALNYLHREELYDKSIVGEFVTGNGERGIRNWSYDDNPVGFGDVGYDTIGAEVHADGEIWTAILWDVRQALVAEFGEAAGSDIAARIVTDAMPLSPNDPSFLDMRDAIVKALDNRFHARPDYPTIFDLVYTEFARRGAGADAATDGGEDIDPTPAFDHVDATRNGVLSGQVVNASTGEPVADARVMIGQFEARVSALRTTGSTGGFSAPAVQGSYPVTIQARGLGSHTFQDVQVTAGETTSLRFELAPNLASEASGAKIVSATSEGAGALLDDTESSSWQSAKGDGNVVIELAKPAEIAAVQVSAFTSSRFEGLRDFTLQVSNDGQVWRTVRSGQGFSYQKPRPVAPDLHYRTFTLEAPVQASHVRFWTDEPFGETKAEVQTGELQVFSETVQGVSPLPPPPPDEPVTDSGTIAAGNPASGSVSGVTASEFEQTCAAPPGSQGTDGWVTTLPDSFGDGMHSVQVKGDSAAPYDLDLYFYDAECNLVGSAASAAADESGTVPSGAKHVLTQLFLGAGVPFDLTATDAGG